MKRICKYCGKEYEGAPGSSACQECVAEHKKTTLRDRICRQCRRTFLGGPRAWYCTECRAERRREADRRHRRNGTTRPIGSMDYCLICGGEYVVNSATQRYCQKCASEAVRQKDRKQSIEWNRMNTTPEQRKSERKSAAAQIKCVICGKVFIPTSRAIACSDECRRELKKRDCASYEKNNRDYRNEYQRNRIKKKEEAMSPEEYQAYREKINKRARENYMKRKLRQTENGGKSND